MADLPLSGCQILDITQNVAGPFCTQILADLGADVIKIEPIDGDSTREWAPPFWKEQSTMFMSFNRNKRSVALDLKRQEGRDLLDQLLQKADVFVQALRPATAARLGLDSKAIRARHPHILVLEITAFGVGGPLADRPGYDPLLQAFSGLISITGHEGSPPIRVATSIIDMSAGMWAAIGILGSLLQRTRPGQSPQVVQTSLFETSLAWLPYQIHGFLATGEAPKRWGSELGMIAPYGAYMASDRPIMIAVGSEKLWRAFCEALKQPGLLNDERFARNPARVEHREALRDRIEKVLSNDSAGKWIEKLNEHHVPATLINTIPEVLDHPQTKATDILQNSPDGDLPLVGIPFSLDDQRPPSVNAPPKLGQHTNEVLSINVGLSREQLAELESKNVIHQDH